MKKSTTLFSSEQISAIESAVKTAESNTSAEIIPVIASSSGRYDRAEDLFAFLLSLLTFSLVWVCFQGDTTTDNWNIQTIFNLNLFTALLVLGITFFIGIALASYFPILRLPLIATQEMRQEVESKARETFQRLRVRDTKNGNGLLIYVSLYEHMVHVVGDDSINEKLSGNDWDELCQMIVNGFKIGQPEQGMVQGILHCGKLLAEDFKISPDDENELSNQLHLLD